MDNRLNGKHTDTRNKVLKRCWKEVIWLWEPHYNSFLSHRHCRQQWITAAEGMILNNKTTYNTIKLVQLILILVQVLQNVSNIICVIDYFYTCPTLTKNPTSKFLDTYW